MVEGGGEEGGEGEDGEDNSPQFSCYQLVSSIYYRVNNDARRIYVSLEERDSASQLDCF